MYPAIWHLITWRSVLRDLRIRIVTDKFPFHKNVLGLKFYCYSLLSTLSNGITGEYQQYDVVNFLHYTAVRVLIAGCIVILNL